MTTPNTSILSTLAIVGQSSIRRI